MLACNLLARWQRVARELEAACVRFAPGCEDTPMKAFEWVMPFSVAGVLGGCLATGMKAMIVPCRAVTGEGKRCCG